LQVNDHNRRIWRIRARFGSMACRARRTAGYAFSMIWNDANDMMLYFMDNELRKFSDCMPLRYIDVRCSYRTSLQYKVWNVSLWESGSFGPRCCRHNDSKHSPARIGASIQSQNNEYLKCDRVV
jgi:hypothetical protein